MAHVLGRTLVFGGSGWLGRELVRQLVAAGAPVTVADLRPSPQVPTLLCDISRGDDVKRVYARVRPETVFHLAAVVDVRAIPDPRIHAVNVEGTRQVLEGARAHGTARVIHTSTFDAVWGGGPMVEADESIPYPAQFPHAYAATKAAGEMLARDAHGAALSTIVLRPAHIYGPGDDILPFLAHSPLRLAGHMSFVYLENIAHAHILAAEALAQGRPVGGRVFFVSDFDDHFCDTYRQLAGRPPAPLPMPSALLEVMTTSVDGVATWVHGRLGWQLHHHPKVSLTRAAMQGAVGTTVCAEAFRRELDYRPIVSRDDALARTRAWSGQRRA